MRKSACAEKLEWECTEELLNILPAYFPGTVQLAYSVIFTEDASLQKLKGSLRKVIYKALWREYLKQFELQFENYSKSERSRAGRLFEVLSKKKEGVIGSVEALEILDNASSEESNMDGRKLLHCLAADSYFELEPGGVKFTSGLVPVWHKMQLTCN